MATLPPFVEKASRLNFCIVRPILQLLYGLIIGLILFIYSFIIGITGFINCFSVLIAGKRFKTHYDFVVKIAKWIGHLYMYFNVATDETPPIFP
ncbi:MAG: DUF4389 domain-containing protein [Candidatus Heimdallarchaeaceae archaeon]